MAASIDDAAVDRALAWLVENADKAAEARAHRVLLEESCRSLKAKLMKNWPEESLGAQERNALATKEYADHLEGLREAVYQDERFRLLRIAAEMRIECWRTASSNARAQGKIG